MVDQVSQFAVAGRLICRTLLPLTYRLSVMAAVVPLAYRILRDPLPATAEETANDVDAVPLWLSV